MSPLQLYGLFTMNQGLSMPPTGKQMLVLRQRIEMAQRKPLPQDDLLQVQPTMRLHMGLVGPGLSGGVRKYVEGMDVRTGAFHGELTQPFCQKTNFSLIISQVPNLILRLAFIYIFA